jgi:hypothetical protein
VFLINLTVTTKPLPVTGRGGVEVPAFSSKSVVDDGEVVKL